jgi:membrane protein DedA with SNARE-associated domain
MNFIIHFIQSFGYPAVFLGMVMTASMIPIPSEIILPFAGFMAQQGTVNFVLVLLVGALGDLTGSLIAYAIGYYLEDHVVLSLIDKYGKYVLFRKHEYERALKWFDRYGNGIVFGSRLVPGVRTFMSLPAGLARMPVAKFALFTFLGSLVWATLLTTIGFYLGRNWESIHIVFSKVQYVVVALIVLAIAYYLYTHLKKKKQ